MGAFFKPGSTSNYTFKVSLNNANNQNLRLWVDSQLIIDKWNASVHASATTHDIVSSETSVLTANKLYDFCVDFKSGVNSDASVTIKSSTDGSSYTAIASGELLQVEDVS